MTDHLPQLLTNIHLRMDALKKCLEEVESHWGGEDGFYRYYHHSYKAFRLQGITEAITLEMANVDPRPFEDRHWSPLFTSLIEAGTNKEFDISVNQHWEEQVGPIVTAYLHAREVLTMMVKYGEELDEAPQIMPSGWALVASVYGMY